MSETSSPDLRERLAAAVRASVDSQIIAEWICCDPIRADHDMCSKADAARQMARTLLTDDPDWFDDGSPVLDAAMGAFQPVLDQRDEAVDELATELAEARTELQKQDAELRRLRTLVDKAEQTLPIEQRRLLAISRMVFDDIAEGRPFTRDEAADLAQRIVDEIGHSVTEEPALGPSFRVEIDQLKATIARVRRMAQVWIDMRPDYPTATREGHGIAYAGEQIVAVLDQPADSREP